MCITCLKEYSNSCELCNPKWRPENERYVNVVNDRWQWCWCRLKVGEVLGMCVWVAGRKQVMLPHCVTGWPDEGFWGLVRPPTAAATALRRTDGHLHVKAVTPTTTTHMHKHTAYDRGIVLTLCYTQLLFPLFVLHDYVMIWLYILVLTDPRPALRDTQQTLWAGQCHFACGSMPNRFKGVVLLAWIQSECWMRWGVRFTHTFDVFALKHPDLKVH